MNIIQQIADELGVRHHQVEAVVQLIDEGNTIPFIARYRKEATGDIGDEALRTLEVRLKYLRGLEERKQEVIASIEEQGKLTEELRTKILAATVLQTVEDLYRPFKQKKSTRATKAKELGLDPVAERLWEQEDFDLEGFVATQTFKEPLNIEQIVAGAKDIIAEKISDSPEIRSTLRDHFYGSGEIESKGTDEEVEGFEMYREFAEKVDKLPNHRILALNRGENTKALKIKLSIHPESALRIIEKEVMRNPNFRYRNLLEEAAKDSFDRLIFPSLEREIRNLLTERAETEAIQIFGKNTKALLMVPPVQARAVLAIDPAYRTGCKIAVLDGNGKLLEYTTVYPHVPQQKWEEAKSVLRSLIAKHKVTLLSLGNGTASRETEQLVAELLEEKALQGVYYTIVSEAGASVYSASKLASEEYPDLDVSIRGAISIGRRLLDPLAELVKIDPKSIGVGQYQHDVNQKQLGEQLGAVVEDVVNSVGVDLNTATPSLLAYVSGINATVAKNIVERRNEVGAYKNRKELLKVKRLGEKVYQQAVGFLRIRDGAEPLDNTAVHPESYEATRRVVAILGIDLHSAAAHRAADITASVERYGGSYAAGVQKLSDETGVGVLTLKDILEELKKPGRDPRDEMMKPVLRRDVLSMDDLYEGIELTGTVRNVVDFGAFVDIGVKQDGLVHISHMSDRFVKHPMDVVKIGDVVTVHVIGIDRNRGKISLSMVGPNPDQAREASRSAAPRSGSGAPRTGDRRDGKPADSDYRQKLQQLMRKFGK
ncbi:MAG: Tex family protein [Bacillota bacterium]|nr:Tex family protein [Bacillota bacterium]